MAKKWIALLCALLIALSLCGAAFASEEASGDASGEASGGSSSASQTRGDVEEIAVPETAADWILSAFSCKNNLFTDEAVPDEVMEEIVAAGINAPSAINTQPWKFIIVKNESLKSSITLGAPSSVGVVVVAVPLEDSPGGNQQFAAGLAAESMYLYAQAIGLGAHMYTAPVSSVNNAKDSYGIPEDYQAAVVIAFGYYEDFVDAASAASVRNEYDSFVTVIE